MPLAVVADAVDVEGGALGDEVRTPGDDLAHPGLGVTKSDGRIRQDDVVVPPKGHKALVPIRASRPDPARSHGPSRGVVIFVTEKVAVDRHFDGLVAGPATHGLPPIRGLCGSNPYRSEREIDGEGVNVQRRGRGPVQVRHAGIRSGGGVARPTGGRGDEQRHNKDK